MEKLVNYCKQHGFIFQGSEIYGGLANTWDYGPLGSRLKNTNVGETVEVGGVIAKKKATVEYTTEYSAHAKADEMIEFLKQFKNIITNIMTNKGTIVDKYDKINEVITSDETK